MSIVKRVNSHIKRNKAADRKRLRAELLFLMSKEWKHQETKSAYMISLKKKFDSLSKDRQISLIKDITEIKCSPNPILPDIVSERRKKVLRMLQKSLADEKH